jgi:uncharacterized membrane protein
MVVSSSPLAGEWGLPPVPPNKPRRREAYRLDTRKITLIAIYAALYAALVAVFSPVSFYALQLRVAGVVRPGIAKMRLLAVGYALGVVVGNLFSPFAGIYELLFMPFMSLVAGLLGYEAARMFKGNYFVCGAVIAVIIPLSVAWMLSQLFGLPLLATLPGLLVSEQVVNLVGAGIFRLVEKRVRWWE